MPRKFLLSLTITIGWMVLMGQLIKPLNSKQIVEFELAGSVSKAVEMIDFFSGSNLTEKVYTSIYLDFVFLVLYAASIFLALIWLKSHAHNHLIQKILVYAAYAIWLAAVSDAIENVGLLQTLSSPKLWSVSITYFFAALKFIIVVLCLLIFLTMGCILGLKKYKRISA